MSDAIKKIDAEVTKFNSEKTKLFSELARNIRPAFDEIFEKYPELNSVGWPQYTPYFNDGDSCIFHVDSYSIRINGVNVDDYDEDEEDVKNFLQSDVDDISEMVSNILNSLPEEFLEEHYGDHTLVTVLRGGGTSTTYYEHD